jgi:hypothetical protein
MVFSVLRIVLLGAVVMPVTVHHSSNELRFTLSHNLAQRLRAWADSIDELVFNEQIATGSFRGRWRVEGELLTMMREIKARGEILPYYGAGGSRGACVYLFQPSPFGYTVRVEHNVTGEAFDCDDEQAAATLPAESDSRRRITFLDHVQRLLGRENSQRATVLPDHSFVIGGREYQALREWSFWNAQAALQQRYIYRFGQVSVGSTGYTVKVEDTISGEVVDVSDYASW